MHQGTRRKWVARVEKRGQYSLRFKPPVDGGQRATKPTWTQRRIAHGHGNGLFSRRGRTDGQTRPCALRFRNQLKGLGRDGRPPVTHTLRVDRLARPRDGRRHAIFPQHRKNGENTCRKYVRETRVSGRTNFCTFSVSHRRLADCTRNVTNGSLATRLS